MSKAVLEKYFDCFNRKDIDGMLDCLSDHVVHYVNEGNERIGKTSSPNSVRTCPAAMMKS